MTTSDLCRQTKANCSTSCLWKESVISASPLNAEMYLFVPDYLFLFLIPGTEMFCWLMDWVSILATELCTWIQNICTIHYSRFQICCYSGLLNVDLTQGCFQTDWIETVVYSRLAEVLGYEEFVFNVLHHVFWTFLSGLYFRSAVSSKWFVFSVITALFVRPE